MTIEPPTLAPVSGAPLRTRKRELTGDLVTPSSRACLCGGSGLCSEPGTGNWNLTLGANAPRWLPVPAARLTAHCYLLTCRVVSGGVGLGCTLLTGFGIR